MAASFNEITIIGNTGADAEYRVFDSGAKMVTLSVCTEDVIFLGGGKTRKENDWHKVICWGSLADSMSNLKKGSQVYVCGKLKQRQWKNDAGDTCYGVEIVASDIQETTVTNDKLTDSDQDFSDNPYQTNNPSRSITHAE